MSCYWGALHRETNQVIAKAVDHTDQETMHAFIHEQTTQEAVIYTDEARCYRGMNRTHSVVCHRRREFVDGTIHTNGIESFWASVKRSYKGTHHWWSRQHLQSDLHELTWKHHHKGKTLLDQMGLLMCQTTAHRTDQSSMGKPKEKNNKRLRSHQLMEFIS